MKRIVAAVVAGIASWLYAQSGDHVRVRLFSQEQPSAIRVTTETGETVNLDARNIKVYRSIGPVAIQRGSSETVRIPYPIEVSTRNGTLLIVTDLPREDYVAAILAGESAGFRSDESLKAMAVAARTYAVHFAHRHQSEGFDFCDSTHCQDFRITAVSDRLRKAVAATSEELLRYDGQPIPAYYHQDCGGVPEPFAPYLRQLRDTFCTYQGRRNWSASLTTSDVQAALGSPDVYRIEVTERTDSGRARRLRISGADTRVMSAEDFRLAIGRRLGWDKIRSDLYEVRMRDNRFVFEGYGSGHGLGLCQSGAEVMGEQGYSYREILAYYYPDTTVH